MSALASTLAGAGLAGALAGILVVVVLRRTRDARRHGAGVVALTSAAFVVIAAGWSEGLPLAPASLAALAAFLVFAATSILLGIVDVETHRLPDAIVIPSYGVAALLLTVAALLGGAPERLLTAIGGASALFACYLLIRLISPRGMGGGDVKLAGVVGAYLGFIGWPTLVVGAVGGFILGGLFGMVLLLFRRAALSTAVPFGPWMLAGAWGAILLSRTRAAEMILLV